MSDLQHKEPLSPAALNLACCPIRGNQDPLLGREGLEGSQGAWHRCVPHGTTLTTRLLPQRWERVRPIPGRDRKKRKDLAVVLGDTCEMCVVLVLLASDSGAAGGWRGCPGRLVLHLILRWGAGCRRAHDRLKGRSASIPLDTPNSYFYAVRHGEASIDTI